MTIFFKLSLLYSINYRVEKLGSREQEVAQPHRTGIPEAALLLHTLLIQIPPAQTSYQTEHPVLQVMSTQMAHFQNHETDELDRLISGYGRMIKISYTG